MPKEFNRTERVAELLQMELATLLQQDIHDPRLAQLTVLEVRVTRDLAHAKVFVSFFDHQKAKEAEALKALKKACGFLRSQLAQRVKLRLVPALQFVFDDTYNRGQRLTDLIESAMSENHEPEE